MIQVIELLLEIVHAHQRLVDQPRSNHPVPNDREIVLTARDGLEILAEHRSSIGDGVTASHEGPHENAVLVVEIVLDVDDAVVALVVVFVGAEEIGNNSRSAANLGRP